MNHKITKHAVARYLERVAPPGATEQQARQVLGQIRAKAAAIGASAITQDGVRYAMKGDFLVSVIVPDGKGVCAAGKGKARKLLLARTQRDYAF